MPSPRGVYINELSNDELRRGELDFLKERRDKSKIKLAVYQRKLTRYYNSKVKKKLFRLNDFLQ